MIRKKNLSISLKQEFTITIVQQQEKKRKKINKSLKVKQIEQFAFFGVLKKKLSENENDRQIMEFIFF